MSEIKQTAKSQKFASLLSKTEQPAVAIDQKKEIFDAFSQPTVKQKIQETVNTVIQGKIKATFELDADLHKRVKLYAAGHSRTKMVDVVTQALTEYLDKREK